MQSSVSSTNPPNTTINIHPLLHWIGLPWVRFLWAVASLGFIGWAAIAFAGATQNPEWPPLANRNELFINFILPLIMALVYWSVGILAWRIHAKSLGTAYFLTLGAMFAAGVLSSIDNAIGGPWFAFLQIWAAPLFLHMHLQLLAPLFPGPGRLSPRLFYIISLVLTIPLFFVNVADWETTPGFPLWRTALRLNIALAILATLLLVGYYYNSNATAIQRRRIRILLCGTLLAVSPLLFLSLLPELLHTPYRFPYQWTLPFLVLNPISYAYVLGLRHQQIRFEVLFQRIATYYLAITLVIGLFFLGFSLLSIALAPIAFDESWVVLLVAIFVLIIFVPLLRQCQTLVRRIWYGREMTSQRMVTWISEALSRTLDWSSLVQLLLSDLSLAMLLQHSVVYLEKDLNTFTLVGASGSRKEDDLPPTLPADSTLVSYLMQAGQPVAHEELRSALDTITLTEPEQVLIDQFPPAHWLPLMSRGQIHGILMMGPRLGDDWISIEDIHVLTTLVNQAGVATHNVRLIEEVRAGRQELAEAHQQLLMARENERQLLARELHDDAVQQLIGIGYQIQLTQKRLQNGTTPFQSSQDSGVVVETLDAVNHNVVDVVKSLRILIRELRPTGLEHIGLHSALLAYIKNLQSQYPTITITLNAEALPSYLSEEIIMGLFRVTQEAIRNAIRHANPQSIGVTVQRIGSHLVLEIADDGCGFDVPAELETFTQDNHFGLAGMRERVQILSGTYQIESAPHQGTKVRVTIPIKGERVHE